MVVVTMGVGMIEGEMCLSEQVVFKETKSASTCEFCGGAVSLKEWFVKDEVGKIDETRSFFLFVCESCGRGRELEAGIERMVADFVRGVS